MDTPVTSPMKVIERLDSSSLTPRDLRILVALLRQGGMCGNDLVVKLRLPSRSSVQANIPKLIRKGMIEDRRAREGQAIPSRLYLTMKGKDFIKEVMEE